MPSPTDILCANLSALAQRDPDLAQRIRDAQPAPLEWGRSRSGLPTASLLNPSLSIPPIALCSRYDPVAEADQIITELDPRRHGGVVILGLGLGYHVQRVCEQMPDNSVVVVFEPNLELVRAVFGRVDHSKWLSRGNTVLADTSFDRSALLPRIERFAAALTQGTVLITHPPTRRLRAAELNAFSQSVTEALAYCRTNIATALVNASRTVRNLVMNLPHYVAGSHTDELLNLAKGIPAVCVGAGPSLAKNAHLLADPAVRSKVIVISAQTTLKPLLDRGIEPDFVTALDFHEISRRFYENLPLVDGKLPGATLVAEPLVNSAVLDHYPGGIRLTTHKYLRKIMGKRMTHPQPIKPGATVAHLSFYLAQYLGCDPIILIGQDLGFSDGLYYCPGTAIHDVWANELGPFNTLEMMEWQRIVRHRAHLQKLEDVHGKAIYSDEQMLTYLKQFERDFATAPQKVIDATEGGLPKKYIATMTLSDALREFATKPKPAIPAGQSTLDPVGLDKARRILIERLTGLTEMRQNCQLAMGVLKRMLDEQRNPRKMDALFVELNTIQARVQENNDTFELLNDLNTIGAFKRDRADRAIDREMSDPLAQQRKRIERDIDNIDWLTQACDEALSIFKEALNRTERVIEQNTLHHANAA
ncbi:MAG: DUF115 domain-containing protein [Phycisphaera sp.]|nr:DUF115 domain-containing protein [Phycisphaera sp.]